MQLKLVIAALLCTLFFLDTVHIHFIVCLIFCFQLGWCENVEQISTTLQDDATIL